MNIWCSYRTRAAQQALTLTSVAGMGIAAKYIYIFLKKGMYCILSQQNDDDYINMMRWKEIILMNFKGVLTWICSFSSPWRLSWGSSAHRFSLILQSTSCCCFIASLTWHIPNSGMQLLSSKKALKTFNVTVKHKWSMAKAYLNIHPSIF